MGPVHDGRFPRIKPLADGRWPSVIRCSVAHHDVMYTCGRAFCFFFFMVNALAALGHVQHSWSHFATSDENSSRRRYDVADWTATASGLDGKKERKRFRNSSIMETIDFIVLVHQQIAANETFNMRPNQFVQCIANGRIHWLWMEILLNLCLE